MIYYIGLIFAILIILFSFDDIIWDMAYLYYKISGKLKKEKVPIKELEEVVPKLLAVIIAAYNEENILEDVIENLVKSQEYPMSLYRIFLGVYPNDPATKEIALKLGMKYKNIQTVTHIIDGPSSKADNINNVIKNIYDYEKANNIRFSGIIIHDSEDIVHPYEFMLENYLFEKNKAIQIPVFPLQEMPKLNNIFKNMVSGTYADEFAENHFRTLNIRNATNAFVPSAGTGFALRRDVLDLFPDHNIFPVGSLTEDFKLSLSLKEKGIHTYYPLEEITRINYKKEEKKEFIATRSMFPKTFRAAVKQKTRWTYGITMESFKMRDIIKNKNFNFQTKWSLFRDWKAKFSNLLILPGYLIFTYFILSYFVNIPIMYVKKTTSFYLMIVLSIFMIEREISRFISVKNVYGIKSGFISAFLPPLIPIRMVLGNLINFTATFKAWEMRIFKNKKSKIKNKGRKSKSRWSKTDHEFLDTEILKRFKRNLGDDLIAKELISTKNLSIALKESEKTNNMLGETIAHLGLVGEKDLIKSIASINNRQYLNKPLGNFPRRNRGLYDIESLRKLKVVPLFDDKTSITLITTINTNLKTLKEYFNKDIEIIYTQNRRVVSCLNEYSCNPLMEEKLYIIEDLIRKGYINARQGIVALRYTKDNGDIIITLKSMGFLNNNNL